MAKIAFIGDSEKSDMIFNVLRLLGGHDSGYTVTDSKYFYYINEYLSITGTTHLNSNSQWCKYTIDEFKALPESSQTMAEYAQYKVKLDELVELIIFLETPPVEAYIGETAYASLAEAIAAAEAGQTIKIVAETIDFEENAASIIRAGYGKTFWLHSFIYEKQTSK